MIWLVEIAVLILGLVAIASVMGTGRRNAMSTERAESRASAYIETLRREATHPEYSQMSDSELKDVLMSAMRRVQADQSRKTLLLVFGAIATLLVAIMFAAEDGVRAFAISLAIGGIALYGVERVLDRAMRRAVEEKDLDIDRLRVD